MQKTFNSETKGQKYKVVIKGRTKLVTFFGRNEQINFYFGNPRFVAFESSLVRYFLDDRVGSDKADEIHSFILNAIK